MLTADSSPNGEAARALVRWQHAAGPFWPYVCAAPFLCQIRIRPRGGARMAASPLVAAMHALPSAERTAVFVDLPAEETLTATPALNQLGFIVVPVIQRWVATPAVLACERLVERLIRCAPRRAGPGGERGAVFVIDGERAGPPDPSFKPSPRLFDNRYAYPICRFPPPSFLQQQGIGAVRWLPSDSIAADLAPYAQQLAEAGLRPR